MVKRGKSARKPGRPGRLRIVAGIWRSRVLEVVDAPGLRPTSERIRETLFNWLAPRIAGARCLDLFAGTGALGFEALSRGAASVVFVEKHAAAVRRLRDNAALLGADGAEIIADDARRFLADARAAPFDIAFLDPPFQENALADLCRLLAVRGLLAPGAIVYLEDDRKRPVVELPAGWQELRKGHAGNVRFALVEAGGATGGDVR